MNRDHSSVRSPHRPSAGGGSQRGVVLFVALIVLIVMTLAGLGLLRQMSAGNAIAGNIAFKESATSTADAGTEAARQWVITTATANAAALNVDATASGYFSTWAGGVDPTQYPWATQSGSSSLDLATGNRVRYIIQRLCETAGLDPADPAQRCSDFPAPSHDTGGSGGYPGFFVPKPPIPFYRITTRVDGARNTTSYTQVLMY